MRHELALDLPAAHRGVRVARNVLRRFARLVGETEEQVEVLVLVGSELLANAIDHGGGGAAMTEDELTVPARMRLSVSIDGEGWTLSVSDEGEGDPAAVRSLFEEATNEDIEHDRGRGLYLLRELVDEVSVETGRGGRGLTVLAKKRRDVGH
jgi:anti-sigma regulatory factor (Ser/Thr protein kinase)